MSEQQLRQIITTLDMRRSQFDNITRQQEMIRASIEEHLRAKETLESYSKTDEDEEMLVPVGAGVFIRVRAGKNEKAITAVGSGVLMERNMAEISTRLETRIDDIRKTAEELGAQAEKISSAIEELSMEAQRQYNALQQPKQDDQTI